MKFVEESGVSAIHVRNELMEGELSAAEARALVAELPEQLDEQEGDALYAGLRAFTWKVLDQKRRDDELRAWIDLIKRATVRLPDGSGRGAQLETLAELIAESVAVAARLPIAELLTRRHVSELLTFLNGAPEQAATKKELMTACALEASNLWRIMCLLSAAGLVDIVKEGRETRYALTRRGSGEAKALGQRRAPRLGTAPGQTGTAKAFADPNARGRIEAAILRSMEQQTSSAILFGLGSDANMLFDAHKFWSPFPPTVPLDHLERSPSDREVEEFHGFAYVKGAGMEAARG